MDPNAPRARVLFNNGQQIEFFFLNALERQKLYDLYNNYLAGNLPPRTGGYHGIRNGQSNDSVIGIDFTQVSYIEFVS